MTDYLVENGGLVFGALAMALATLLSGMGSAKGTGMTGEAAAALTVDLFSTMYSPKITALSFLSSNVSSFINLPR